MEYAIRTTQTFQQVIEALVSALEERGFTVRRSFDLQSALWDRTEQEANYCILMVKPASMPEPGQRTRILAMYQRAGQPVLNLLRPCPPLPRLQAKEASSPSLEAALVDLLLEEGWWSMEESEAVV